jgi:hypothetical protein
VLHSGFIGRSYSRCANKKSQADNRAGEELSVHVTSVRYGFERGGTYQPISEIKLKSARICAHELVSVWEAHRRIKDYEVVQAITAIRIQQIDILQVSSRSACPVTGPLP